MQSVKHMKVVTQLILGFSVAIILMIALGAFCLSEISGENLHVVEFRDNWLPSVRSSQQMLAALRQIRINGMRSRNNVLPMSG
ncbi:MCP four helix bundle domain-containing protein [Paraburkholderia pallida]|uniref:Uncharacterized protein n=1 Tax=Paraburkholderia pallida TaxID=2547399 RepID=A0A4P7DAR6_9BURK|nr:MCP four helix bundle domain-containing protein [Paraburkholderia pallida]QBR04024.1 hypothetical protein E1956_43315 [Paraburkholderia pallida]